MKAVLFNDKKTSVRISNNITSQEINNFLKESYTHLNLGYPKFFKMDNLCKLGVIGVELLYKENVKLFERTDKVGLIFQNRSSSLDTDIRHHKGIENNTVSPAIFVYSLPNIVLGEISIKHRWSSEGVFFVNEEIDFDLLSQYSNILLGNGRTKLNLIGWIDVLQDQYILRLCLVEDQLTSTELERLLI